MGGSVSANDVAARDVEGVMLFKERFLDDENLDRAIDEELSRFVSVTCDAVSLIFA